MNVLYEHMKVLYEPTRHVEQEHVHEGALDRAKGEVPRLLHDELVRVWAGLLLAQRLHTHVLICYEISVTVNEAQQEWSIVSSRNGQSLVTYV